VQRNSSVYVCVCVCECVCVFAQCCSVLAYIAFMSALQREPYVQRDSSVCVCVCICAVLQRVGVFNIHVHTAEGVLCAEGKQCVRLLIVL